jgi:hypothetical protein
VTQKFATPPSLIVAAWLSCDNSQAVEAITHNALMIALAHVTLRCADGLIIIKHEIGAFLYKADRYTDLLVCVYDE